MMNVEGRLLLNMSRKAHRNAASQLCRIPELSTFLLQKSRVVNQKHSNSTHMHIHNPDDRLTMLRMDTPSSPAVRTLVHSKLVKAQKVSTKVTSSKQHDNDNIEIFLNPMCWPGTRKRRRMVKGAQPTG
jgi:hypothetical protein